MKASCFTMMTHLLGSLRGQWPLAAHNLSGLVGSGLDEKFSTCRVAVLRYPTVYFRLRGGRPSRTGKSVRSF